MSSGSETKAPAINATFDVLRGWRSHLLYDAHMELHDWVVPRSF